mgnify:FL=1
MPLPPAGKAGAGVDHVDQRLAGDVRGGLGPMPGVEIATPGGRPDTATAVAVQQAASRHRRLTLTCMRSAR